MRYLLFLGASLTLLTACHSPFTATFRKDTPTLKYYDVASITARSTHLIDSTKQGYILSPDQKEAFFNAVASAEKSDIKVAGVYLVQIHLKSGSTIEIGASSDRLFKAKTGVYSLPEDSPTFSNFFKK